MPWLALAWLVVSLYSMKYDNVNGLGWCGWRFSYVTDLNGERLYERYFKSWLLCGVE